MLNNLRHIYFLGVGGIGMSALARYFLLQGVKVSGYDKTSTQLTKVLESEGINIHYTDKGQKALEGVDMIVYTPAIPKELKEFQAFSNSDIPMLKRAEVLGEISKDYFTIAVAGTHGKTTITSMVAHFLSASGISVNAFIGGIANNYNSNLILSKDAKIMVVEADEFDRSFLHIHPDIAIISSMDADHLDIYGSEDYLKESFYSFIRNIKEGGSLILYKDLDAPKDFQQKLYRYGTESDYCLIPKGIKSGKQIFDVSFNSNNLGGFEISIPGRHNLLNATAAIAAAEQLNVDLNLLSKAIESYTGVKRRFELKINTSDTVLIDDYAHHPTEIKAAIAAAREMFSDKKLMGIFQPHLYTRTRDFAQEFANELSKLDVVVLLDIYPARELPIKGIDSQMLLDRVSAKEKYLVSKQALPEFVKQNSCAITLIMGAGDIDTIVEPIKEILLNNA